MSTDPLEKYVTDYKREGDAWVSAKLKADQLEEDRKSFLAAIISESDDGQTSEARLERRALASKEYRDFIASMCAARAEMLRHKVRFDALGMLFEAKRSERAFERETVKKGIFHAGG